MDDPIESSSYSSSSSSSTTGRSATTVEAKSVQQSVRIGGEHCQIFEDEDDDEGRGREIVGKIAIIGSTEENVVPTFI
jgi:hypothetical protein